MTSEQRAPSAFQRAEASSRQIVLQIGLGVAAFVIGSIASAGASARVLERIGPIESDGVAWVLHQMFERLWLVSLAPLFGWMAGRFTQIPPRRFALVSVLSGETFAVLLVSGINGFEYVFADASNVVARVVTLFLGLLATHEAVRAGQGDAQAAQAAADAIAEKRKAEYAEYLAAAETGKPSPQPSPSQGEGEKETHLSPSPRGGVLKKPGAS